VAYMKSVHGSNGTNLKFLASDEDIHKKYLAEVHEAEMRAYEKLRSRNGKWSSNRDKYLPVSAELSDNDSRAMEDRYAAWAQPKQSNERKPFILWLYGKHGCNCKWEYVARGSREKLEKIMQDTDSEYVSFQTADRELDI
jgi:hypothetical protein